jgi:hypothetical protein
MIGKNNWETDIPSWLIPTLILINMLLVHLHLLIVWLNIMISTFNVGILLCIEMTPYTKMNYFQKNIHKKSASQFCNYNSNISSTIIKTTREFHMFCLMIFKLNNNIILIYFIYMLIYSIKIVYRFIDNLLLNIKT